MGDSLKTPARIHSGAKVKKSRPALHRENDAFI
jgi:hypothetical protein